MPLSPAPAAFQRGVLGALPFLLVVGPFGLLFGVVAIEAGLDPVAVTAMSVLVIAGAAQFAALQLLVDEAPTVMILAAALAVNLRMAMYSAAMAPHLGSAPLRVRALAAYLLVDQTYAASALEFDRRPEMSLGEKLGFFFGSAAPVVPVWYISVLVGALFGQRIPETWALDFAVPIAFIAIMAPMVRTLAHLVAVGVSIAGALVFLWLPYDSGLLVAAALAMMAGAEVERRRAGPR